MQDSSQARHSIARDKGKEPIVPNNVDTPTDNELSSSNLPDLSLAKSSRARLRQRCSHRPAFSNAVSGTLRRARKKVSRGQNQLNGVPRNASTLPTSVMPPIPPVYPAFSTRPMLYIPPAATIRSPDNMLSSPLGQHILNYEPP